MPPSQKNRQIVVKTALGADILLFHQMRGTEELGRLSEYRLDLLSQDDRIDCHKMLGHDLSISVKLAAGGERQFNGIVTQFSMIRPSNPATQQLALYQAAVRPRLWLLTRAKHCRFFCEQSVPQILLQILQDYSIDVSNKCSASYPQLAHCTQYRETDFNFVSRLMEKEGIYYYFEQQNGKHTLILSDAPDSHKTLPDYAEIKYRPSVVAPLEQECIYDWNAGFEIQSSAYELNDYFFEKPSLSNQQGLLARAKRAGRTENLPGLIQEHPGGYSQIEQGERYARVGVEVCQTRMDCIRGATTARGIRPGGLFELKEHPRSDLNGKYMIVSAHYALHSDAYTSVSDTVPVRPIFDCQFTAVRKETGFRSERITPKPLCCGPQSAVVVGPDNEEIWTDEYGRVKVQFHWEQLQPPASDKKLQRCWVRVSQNWAGKRWGTFFLPRVGQEVIVDFLEGDPDRPLVVGAFYNANTMPPYKLPANRALTTIKSQSSKDGSGSNELRFNDTKGEEQLFFHAEKDHETYVKNDSLSWVGHDHHEMVQGSQFLNVAGTRHQTIKGESNEKVDGNISLTAAQNMQQKVGKNYALESSQNIHLKAGMNLVIEAGQSITLKAGGAFIVIGPVSVAISGTPIQLNSGGKAGAGVGASPTAPLAAQEADDGTKKLKS
ncbi:MAG: type VI secretion system secreted protein VgrG [Glomeribacter sp. 1016415]|nr:type VI secretion system secreted protein VgrG [Glomeribacter sp. 1016415]